MYKASALNMLRHSGVPMSRHIKIKLKMYRGAKLVPGLGKIEHELDDEEHAEN